MKVWCWSLNEIHKRVVEGLHCRRPPERPASSNSLQWPVVGVQQAGGPRGNEQTQAEGGEGQQGWNGGWTDKGGWAQPLASLPTPQAGATAAGVGGW